MIDFEITQDIAVVRIAYGKANLLDLEFCSEMVHVLGELNAMDVRAIVVTGSGKIFSAGVDLFRFQEGGPEYAAAFVPLLSETVQKLFTIEKPVVAAINGHAIAGGCLVAVACDYRVMVDEGAKIGIPELAVGVPFPGAAVEILRHNATPRVLTELLYLSRLCSPVEALERGLVHELAAPENVLPRAMGVADRLGSIPAATFQITKKQLHRPALGERAPDAEALDQRVLATWQSPEARDAVRSYLAKTLEKK